MVEVHRSHWVEGGERCVVDPLREMCLRFGHHELLPLTRNCHLR